MCGAVYKYFFKLQMYSSKSEGLSHAVNFSVEAGKEKKKSILPPCLYKRMLLAPHLIQQFLSGWALKFGENRVKFESD